MTAAARQKLATPQEVSEHYQIPVETLYQWRRRRIGPRWAKLGHHVRYRWADVERFFDERAKAGAA